MQSIAHYASQLTNTGLRLTFMCPGALRVVPACCLGGVDLHHLGRDFGTELKKMHHGPPNCLSLFGNCASSTGTLAGSTDLNLSDDPEYRFIALLQRLCGKVALGTCDRACLASKSLSGSRL